MQISRSSVRRLAGLGVLAAALVVFAPRAGRRQAIVLDRRQTQPSGRRCTSSAPDAC